MIQVDISVLIPITKPSGLKKSPQVRSLKTIPLKSKPSKEVFFLFQSKL